MLHVLEQFEKGTSTDCIQPVTCRQYAYRYRGHHPPTTAAQLAWHACNGLHTISTIAYGNQPLHGLLRLTDCYSPALFAATTPRLTCDHLSPFYHGQTWGADDRNVSNEPLVIRPHMYTYTYKPWSKGAQELSETRTWVRTS